MVVTILFTKHNHFVFWTWNISCQTACSTILLKSAHMCPMFELGRNETSPKYRNSIMFRFYERPQWGFLVEFRKQTVLLSLKLRVGVCLRVSMLEHERWQTKSLAELNSTHMIWELVTNSCGRVLPFLRRVACWQSVFTPQAKSIKIPLRSVKSQTHLETCSRPRPNPLALMAHLEMIVSLHPQAKIPLDR